MTADFNDQINKFIHSLNVDQALIHYGAFDFTEVHDSRSQLMQMNYDKNKVSFVNLEMVRRKYFSFSIVQFLNIRIDRRSTTIVRCSSQCNTAKFKS